MKKVKKCRGIAVLLCSALILPNTVFSSGYAEEVVMGDLNNDSVVDGYDLILLRRGVANGTELPYSADVTGDGLTDAADLRLLQDFIHGKNVTFARPDVSEYQTRYYAVDAEGSDGWEETTNAGFEGRAYWNYNNAAGSSLTWKVDVPEDGNYAVTFRYANGSSVNRSLQITLNDSTDTYYTSFDSTGNWTTWQTSTVILPLKAGSNTIKTVSATENGGPNMDYIEIEKTAGDAAAPAVTQRYYAVDSNTYKSWEETTNTGFAGSAYINYENCTGSYIEWNVEAPEDGNYEVDFRYANGTDVNRQIKIITNGDKVNGQYLDFQSSGSWSQWSDNKAVVSLKKGSNTIKAYATTSNGGPNIDYIELIQRFQKPRKALG